MTVEAFSVGRFHAVYRLPAAELDARRRLDALILQVLDAAVAEALARTGVKPEEEVCIRSVTADARVRLAGTDQAVVSDWGSALASVIAKAIEAGEPQSVRYASRRQALVDLAFGAAGGDLRRAWAWEQLGLWPDEAAVDGIEAASRLADALCAEPQSIVSVLSAVARRGALPRLAVLLPAADWLRLARAALTVAGAPTELLDAGLRHTQEGRERPEDRPGHTAGRDDDTRELAVACRLLGASAIAIAAVGSGASLGLSVSARRALAVLAILETDPAAFTAASPVEAGRLVDALEAELDATALRDAPSSGSARPAARTTDAAAEPVEPAAPAYEPGAQTGEAGTDADRPRAPELDDAEAPVTVRARAWTSYGGLLFLLPFATALVPFEGRTVRWTMHQLALALLPELDETDPAALAFAGLSPEESPPSDEADPPSADELERLESLAATIEKQLAELLERDRDPELLETVCARRAEIVADPGWIEVHLDPAELDLDIRRAGLDLDPGWIPWLGVVVRFVYA